MGILSWISLLVAIGGAMILLVAWQEAVFSLYLAEDKIEPDDQADESQELTSVDIDTFLASFSSSATRVGLGTVRTSYGIDPYFALG
jgi:hypothetical protein